MATGGAIVFSYIENKLANISGTHGQIFMQIFLFWNFDVPISVVPISGLTGSVGLIN